MSVMTSAWSSRLEGAAVVPTFRSIRFPSVLGVAEAVVGCSASRGRAGGT